MSSPVSPRGAPSTPRPPKPRLISELNYAVLKKLSDRLDMPGEGNWRKLISVLPGVSYDQATVEKFGLNGNRVEGSPSYALMTDLSNRGISYDVLITGLKKLHFGAALTDLGYREEVKFKVHPVATPAIEGQKSELTCEATGIPAPSYLWFKAREPLSDQVSNILVIERVAMGDAGMYTCRASNDVNTLFSNWAEIIVQKPPVLRKQVIPGNPQVTDMPILRECPEPHMAAALDSKLHLRVVATGHPGVTLSYQWLRDTKPLEYALSPDLVIPRVSLKDFGAYNCRVTSDLGVSVLTPSCMVSQIQPNEPVMVDHPSRGPRTPGPNHHANHPHQMPDYNDGMYQQPQPHTGMVPADMYCGGGQALFSGGGMVAPPGPDYQLMPGHEYILQPGYTNNEYYQGSSGGYDRGMDPPPGQVDDGAGGQGELPDLWDKCYDKVALLVGNKKYHKSELLLNTPDRDAQDLAGVLQSAGFKVVSLIDLSKREMEKAVDYFATLIGKNVYALFFFAGHGFEYNARNYMMPVDADVEKKPEQCVCAQEVLDAMQVGGAKLSIMILDMCRVSASTYPNSSTPVDYAQLNFVPSARATGYFLLAFSCTRAERAYEASTEAESLQEKDKNNSIFVSALKEHLDDGTLNQRLDTLLTDAAAKVRDRGRDLKAAANGWMRPEIRHNMAGPLSLADEVKRGPDTEREERAQVWQRAHFVPESVVIGCQGSDVTGAKPSEIAVRLHFEAEHSNVLIVTAELLNGCLAKVEVHRMTMCLVQDGIPHHPKLKASDFDKEYRFSDRGTYRVDHIPCPNDILHFRIPGVQKIRSPTVTLEIEVDYTFQRAGAHRQQRHTLLSTTLPPPLYSQVTVHGPINSPDTSYHGNRV